MMTADMINDADCQCSPGKPDAAHGPCLHCGGDNGWCSKHYGAPQPRN